MTRFIRLELIRSLLTPFWVLAAPPLLAAQPPMQQQVEATTPATSALSVVTVSTLDSSLSYDVECGVERKDCKVTFGKTHLEISDGSQIAYSSIADFQGTPLAESECSKELPKLPYVKQAKGFPCWAATASWVILVAHKETDQRTLVSAFSFKNARVYKEFLINLFAAKHGGSP